MEALKGHIQVKIARKEVNRPRIATATGTKNQELAGHEYSQVRSEACTGNSRWRLMTTSGYYMKSVLPLSKNLEQARKETPA